jgi:hypothetical protein
VRLCLIPFNKSPVGALLYIIVIANKTRDCLHNGKPFYAKPVLKMPTELLAFSSYSQTTLIIDCDVDICISFKNFGFDWRLKPAGQGNLAAINNGLEND